MTQNPIPEPIQSIQPVQPSQPAKNNSFLVIILSIFLLIAVGIAGLFYFQIQKLSKELSKYQAQASPTPIATLDPTANWKTYTNHTHNISFKYPSSWSLIEEEGQKEGEKIYNTKVKLTKADALITIYSNLNGIGGMSQTYEGKAFILDGHNLYQFNKTNSYNNTKDVGISDSLTTLGVFMVDNITYSIIITYPANYGGSDEENLLKEFNQILSTFKFLESASQNDKDLTKEECTQQGGVWQQWGKLKQEYCQIPAPDAGKSCTDGSQCSMGSCVAINGKVPGECQTYKAIFGCNKFVTNGVIDDSKTICVD